MKKFLLVVYSILGINLIGVAQVLPPPETKDLVILKFVPLAFFDIDNTVQLGVEVPLKDRRFTIHQELGYGHSVFNPWYINWDNELNKQTFRSRSQFRFYFHEWGAGRMYVAVEYLHKRVTAQQQMWAGVNCDGNQAGCDYHELRDVKGSKIINALHTKVGWHFYLGNRITLDLYVGGGLRLKSYNTTPDNVGRVQFGKYGWFDDLDFWEDHVLYPSLTTGFQLGIPLGKKK